MARVMKKTPEWYCPHCLISMVAGASGWSVKAANCGTTHDVLAMRVE